MSIDTDAAMRHRWPDVAKGLGIVLMIYGHVLAALPNVAQERGDGVALEQMRFIYAFHMPMFFMVAGFFFRPRADFRAAVASLARRRLVPVLGFGLMMVPLWALALALGSPHPWRELGTMLLGYLRGRPELNWVTWFLWCLFSCEVLAQVVLPKLRSGVAQLLCGAAFVVVGDLLCNHADTAAHLFGVESHTWFLYEAVVALGLYAIGHALWPTLIRLATQRHAAVLVAVVGFAIVAWTYPMNDLTRPVQMAGERQGSAIPFLIAAVAGSVALLSTAMVLQRSAALREVGTLSLPLLGLNGIFYHFVNHWLTRAWSPPDRVVPVTVYTLCVSVGTLAMMLPVARWLQRRLPWMLGLSGKLYPTLAASPGTATASGSPGNYAH